MSTQKYFAADDAKTVISHLEESRQSWYTNLSRTGLRERWRKSFNLYFGKHFDAAAGNQGTAMQRGGAKGELVAFAVNHYRNLIRNTLILATEQRPSFDVRATTTDSDALDEAKLGNELLESDFKFKNVDSLLSQTAERALVFGKSSFASLWHPGKGKPYAQKPMTTSLGQPVLDDSGQPKAQIIYEGDIEDTVLGPYDVLIDQGVKQYDKRPWEEMRLSESKWDLAAQFPSLAEKIIGLPSVSEIDVLKGQMFNHIDFQTDIIPKFIFIHRATPALPQGRMLVYLSADVVLVDGPAPKPYRDWLPSHRIVPGEYFETTEGWSDAFDLQGIQEALNILVSIGFTNLQANGVQKLWVPEGANVSATTLSKGLAILRTPAGMEPKALQLAANPADLLGNIQMLVKSGETISGINSVARGDPDHQLKSGIALAYVEAMAARYTSDFQKSWTKLLENSASYRIELYKAFASNERIIDVVGRRNSSYTASFTGDKLSKIRRVVCDVGNPLTKTMGGRFELADDLKAMGAFKTPQDYITFMETGKFETLTEDSYDQMSAIHHENDLLTQGQPVQAIPGDAHLLHMQKHLALISNPAVRMNAQFVQGVIGHVMQHKQIKMTQDPIFDVLTGEPPLPPPPPPPGMGPPPGPPGLGGPPPGPPGPGGPPPGPPQGPGGQHPMHPPGRGQAHPPGPPLPHPPHPGPGHPSLAQVFQAPGPGATHIPRLPQNLQPGQPQ